MGVYSPLQMQIEIDSIMRRVVSVTGLEKVKLIQEYRTKTKLYNQIVQFNAYNVDFNEWHLIQAPVKLVPKIKKE